MSKQISDLNSAGTLAGTEEFATVQSGETKKSTPAQMADYVSTNMTNIEADSISFNSGADTLSNYETGTFTPTLDLVNVTYTSQSGSYERIGNTYFCKFKIDASSIDTADNSGVRIGGLPFTISVDEVPVVELDLFKSTAFNFSAGDVFYITRGASTSVQLSNANASSIIRYNGGKINASGIIQGSFVYSV